MIEYQNVTKIFGVGKEAVTATENVNFTIEEGEVVVFLGPSGCGKTTMLRMTNRLESISRGTIRVDGRDIQKMDPVRLRQSMGYVIQQIGLFPNKTIAQNVAVVPKLLGWDKERIRDRVDYLLTMVKLDPDMYRNRYPVELSGGQQQRVGVARALGADPKILLMDEPFGAIDPINRDQIQDEFLRLQHKLKKTIAFVSHDIHEAIKMGDKIAIFKDGRLIQYDTPEAILMRPRNKFVSDFVGADRALKVLGLLRAKDAMNTAPRNIIEGNRDAADVLGFMEDKRIRTGIVVLQDKPVGYVTPRGLKYETGPVKEHVAPFPEHLELGAPLRDVLSTMLLHDIMMLCVVDENGTLAGTIDYPGIQRSILGMFSEEEV
ncbi:MAG: ABC transporter ATP-binding protein [Desulfovibrionales bacterium]